MFRNIKTFDDAILKLGLDLEDTKNAIEFSYSGIMKSIGKLEIIQRAINSCIENPPIGKVWYPRLRIVDNLFVKQNNLSGSLLLGTTEVGEKDWKVVIEIVCIQARGKVLFDQSQPHCMKLRPEMMYLACGSYDAAFWLGSNFAQEIMDMYNLKIFTRKC